MWGNLCKQIERSWVWKFIKELREISPIMQIDRDWLNNLRWIPEALRGLVGYAKFGMNFDAGSH